MNVMKTSVRSLASLAAVFAAAATSLSAQSAEILAQSGNAAFLEGLWRYNFIDQAKKVGDLVEASNLSEGEKKAVAEIYRRLKIAISIKNDDAIARRDLVLQGLKEKAAQFKAAQPNSDAAVQLLSEYIDQFRLLADALVGAFAQEQAPEKVTEMRKTYDELFTAAEAELEAAKKAGESHREDDKPGTEIPLLVAYYGLGRIYYYHSLIHPEDSLLGKRKAEQALSTLEEFDLEFSDTLTAYEAKLTQALAHKRLGNLDAAMSACDDAIRLREAFGEKDKNGVWAKVEPDGADVISAAVLQKTLFLEDQKNHAQIVEVASDYLKSIPQALEAMRGKDVLAALAKAHFNLGDNQSAKKEAEQLMEFGGPAGAQGQALLALLAASGTVAAGGPSKMLRLAESEASRGEYERALQLCREVQRNATAPEDEKFAAEAMLITGAIYATRQWFHEASVAFDAVVRRYPKTEFAPDALWRSIACYNQLLATDKAPMFKREADLRGKQLVADYPTHSRVASLQLTEGQQLEGQKKFLEAAKAYETIAADSTVYQEARYRAATCYHKHARSLANGGQEKEAEQFSQKAQQAFESLLPDIENAIERTTDARVKARLASVAFDARVDLVNLLFASKAKPEDIDKVLAKLSAKDDDNDAPIVWGLQIRSKLAKGDVDGAAAQMEGALSKVGDKPALLITARSLAVAMDNQAVELDKNKQHQQAQGVWRKAATFYVKSASIATVTEATQIADRLRVIGMIENKLDDKVESWFELSSSNRVSSEAWTGAVQIYRRMVDAEAQRVDHRVLIGLARVLGFQGQWNDAETVLSRLFTQEKIVAANKRVDSALLAKKPELLTAYLEHGFVLQLATSGDEKARRAKASDIFERVVLSVPADSRHWWHAKYGQIKTLFDRGLYDQAEVAMNSVERNNPDFDMKDGKERFGLTTKLKQLKQQIASKMPRK